MKHKLSKEICSLCPNSSLPRYLQVRPSHTLVPHFHYFHGKFYIVPPEIYHTLHWKWNCCLTPNLIPSPGILFCKQRHHLESDPGPRAHRAGIPLSLSLSGAVTKPLLSLPKLPVHAYPFFSFLISVPPFIFLLLAPTSLYCKHYNSLLNDLPPLYHPHAFSTIIISTLRNVLSFPRTTSV